MKFKPTIDKILIAGIALLLFSIVAIILVFIAQSRRVNDTAKLVAHTREVLFRSEKILSIVTEAETGSRAYLFTGQPFFLESFKKSKAEFSSAIATLRQLTLDNPSQQTRIDSILNLVSRRIAFSDSIIQLNPDFTPETARQFLATIKSTAYINNTKQLTGLMLDEENNLLRIRKKANSQAETVQYDVFLGVVFLLMVLLTLLLWKEKQLAGDKQRKKSEAIFRGLLESAPDGMVIVNEQGEIVLINQQTEKLFGYSKKELIGKTFELLLPGTPENLIDNTSLFAEQPIPWAMLAGREWEAVKKNGGKFPVEISISTFQAENSLLHSAALRDISGRKKQEDTLRKTEKNFQLLVSSVKDYAILLLDINGCVASWNSGAQHIKGYSAEEIIGQPIDVFYTAEDIANGRPQHNLRMALQHGHFETEGWRLRKDGSLFYANIVFTSLTDDKGIFYGYAKVAKDITEKRKAEQRIRLLATIANNIQDPIIATDNDFNITRWNEAAEKLFEWKSEEAIGKSTAEILRVVYPYHTREQLLQLFNEEGFWQGELVYHAKSGRPLNVLITVSILKDLEGNITGNLILARDITQRKIAEAALVELNAQLEQRVKDRTKELEKSGNRFRALVENNEGIISLIDDKSGVLFRSASSMRITGWDHEENERIFAREYIHPEDTAQADAIMAEALANEGKTIPIAMRVRHKNGYYIWLEGVVTNMLHNPDIEGIIINFRDTTKRKEAEQKIIKANRLYFFISQINQMIVRTTDEAMLFKKACQIAVDLGKFRMAWIGMMDEKTKKIIPVTHAGEGHDRYLSNIKTILMQDVPEGGGPIGSALLEGKNIVSNDIENDPQMTKWKETAVGFGYLSSMSLPIVKFGKVVGAFIFYAPVKNFFDEAEIILLEEATGDVAFALEIFEKETRRKKAEEEVIKQKKLSDSIIESLPGVFYIFNQEGRILRWNKNFETVSKYGVGEIKAMHPLDFFDDGEKERVAKTIGNVFITGEDNIQANFLLKTTKKIPYYFTGIAIEYEGGACLMGVGIDISQTVEAQEKTKQTSEQLRQLAIHLQIIREEERKRIGREIHDELGQQLTAIKMDVAWMDKKIPEETILVKNKIKNVIKLLDGSNLSIRRILSELRPRILDDQGLLEAIEWLSRQFTANTDIPVKFATELTEIKSSEPIATCIFRLYQEAFTNITRYARATTVFTSLGMVDETLMIVIEDNGQGFDTSLVQTNKSFGILGMRERVLSLGGKFQLESSPGNGTKLTVQLPNKNQ